MRIGVKGLRFGKCHCDQLPQGLGLRILQVMGLFGVPIYEALGHAGIPKKSRNWEPPLTPNLTPQSPKTKPKPPT